MWLHQHLAASKSLQASHWTFHSLGAAGVKLPVVPGAANLREFCSSLCLPLGISYASSVGPRADDSPTLEIWSFANAPDLTPVWEPAALGFVGGLV